MASWTRCIANRQCFAHVRRFVVFVFEDILLTIATTFSVEYTLLLESDVSSCTRCMANRQCFAHVRRFVVFVFEEILVTTSITSATVRKNLAYYYY